MDSIAKTATRIWICIFFLSCSTTSVPRTSDQRFDSQPINSFILVLVDDPTWCGYHWTPDELNTVEQALSEVITEMGFKLDDIFHMPYDEAKATFGQCLHLTVEDTTHAGCIAKKPAVEKNTAIMITYIGGCHSTFVNHFPIDKKVTVPFITSMRMGYCAISAASGMKLICQPCHSYHNAIHNRLPAGYDTLNDSTYTRYKVSIHPNHDTYTFVKKTAFEVFDELPWSE